MCPEKERASGDLKHGNKVGVSAFGSIVCPVVRRKRLSRRLDGTQEEGSNVQQARATNGSNPGAQAGLESGKVSISHCLSKVGRYELLADC